jgi:hypothetical protein
MYIVCGMNEPIRIGSALRDAIKIQPPNAAKIPFELSADPSAAWQAEFRRLVSKIPRAFPDPNPKNMPTVDAAFENIPNGKPVIWITCTKEQSLVGALKNVKRAIELANTVAAQDESERQALKEYFLQAIGKLESGADDSSEQPFDWGDDRRR